MTALYSMDTGDRAAADLDAQTRAAEAMDPQAEQDAFGVCPECGSADGMQHYDRECVRRMLQPFSRYYKPEAWYRLISPPEMRCQHYVYAPCWGCNLNGCIPEGFELLDAFVLEAWLAQPCQCEDCRRERK